MRLYKFYALFLTIIVVVLATSAIVQGEMYPVAMVDNSIITKRMFEEGYRANAHSLETIEQALSAEFPGASPGTPSLKVKAATLNGLIETALVRKEARRELEKDLPYLIDERIRFLTKDTELQKAVESLYGLDSSRLRELVLVPQAERDILAGRLALRSKTFEEWITEKKAQSSVKIFLEGLVWDGREVVAMDDDNDD